MNFVHLYYMEETSNIYCICSSNTMASQIIFRTD